MHGFLEDQVLLVAYACKLGRLVVFETWSVWRVISGGEPTLMKHGSKDQRDIGNEHG